MEFLIGSEVTGINDIVVPQEYNTVSKKHAKITITQDSVLLQDLDSTNGTFVNSERVITKYVTTNDKICLGIGNKFEVNITEIVNKYNDIINENKTDYSLEFDNLKKVYDEYKKKINKINELRTIQQIIFPLSGSIVLVSKALINDTETFTILSILISITVLFFYIYVWMKSKKSNDIKQLIDIEYIDKYKCPKKSCNFIFQLSNDNFSWLKLKHNKTCPNKCGAIYSK